MSMDFNGYVERVNYHLHRFGVKETAYPTEQEYLDGWNAETIAHKFAATWRRRHAKDSL